MEKVYHNISRSINIEGQRQESSELYNQIKKRIIDGLKMIPTFAVLFREDKLSGSYADKLKISNADEYDLLLRFAFPARQLIEIQLDKESTGNILINIEGVLTSLQADRSRVELYYLLKKWVDDRGFLLQNKFLSWFQSCFTQVLNDMQKRYSTGSKEYQLRYSTSGPAHTIKVHNENQTFILSIDFVPVIVFEKRDALSKRELTSEFWDAVPRPLKGAIQRDNPSFRTSYTDSERKILTGKMRMKVVLRLLKKFRDMKPNMNHFKSYYIKTVFLWLVEDNKDNHTFWEQPVHKLVSVALEKLEEVLLAKELKFFWHPDLNMLNTVKPTQLEEMHRAVQQGIKTLYNRVDQKDVINLFLTAEDQINIPREEMQLMSDCLEQEFIYSEPLMQPRLLDLETEESDAFKVYLTRQLEFTQL